MIDYDPHLWRSHFFAFRGTTLREVVPRVLVCTAWAAAVVAADRHGWQARFPTTVHALVGVALGLLLVFRTNSAYDRFWEGRKLWGGIVNETRNLARASKALVGRDAQTFGPIVRWTIAFAWSSMNLLRGAKDLGPVPGLPRGETEDVLAAVHIPLAVSIKVSEKIAEARKRGLIGEVAQMALDQNVQFLVDYMGSCERIKKTPLPFAYAIHVRRALIFYLFSLPFALVGDFGWVTVPALAAIAYVFMGIEEIGVEIEDPFGLDPNDLPLERICTGIQKTLLDVLGEELGETTMMLPGSAQALVDDED